MRVKVTTILHLVEVLGGRELEMEVPEGMTVAGLLAHLAARAGSGASAFSGADGVMHAHIRVLLNGRQLSFLEHGPDTVLVEGDEVLLLPPAAGG
ncbi:MAG: MoaD/ThiS family protein [Thermoleophilia bacterium]|nr:MoaD/ThiS family protein [Thermoleophilia bacterium]